MRITKFTTTHNNHASGTQNKSSAVAEMDDCLAIDMAQKVEGCYASFCGKGAGSPSNTVSPGPRSTSTHNICAKNYIHRFVYVRFTAVQSSDIFWDTVHMFKVDAVFLT